MGVVLADTNVVQLRTDSLPGILIDNIVAVFVVVVVIVVIVVVVVVVVGFVVLWSRWMWFGRGLPASFPPLTERWLFGG